MATGSSTGTREIKLDNPSLKAKKHNIVDKLAHTISMKAHITQAAKLQEESIYTLQSTEESYRVAYAKINHEIIPLKTEIEGLEQEKKSSVQILEGKENEVKRIEDHIQNLEKYKDKSRELIDELSTQHDGDIDAIRNHLKEEFLSDSASSSKDWISILNSDSVENLKETKLQKN